MGLTSPVADCRSVDVVVAGVRVTFESDIRACLDAVVAVHAAPPSDKAHAECHVRIMRRPDAALDLRPPGVQWARPGPRRVTVKAPGLDALLDVAEGLAVVQVDDAFVRNASQFRRTVLEDIVASLLLGREQFATSRS